MGLGFLVKGAVLFFFFFWGGGGGGWVEPAWALGRFYLGVGERCSLPAEV